MRKVVFTLMDICAALFVTAAVAIRFGLEAGSFTFMLIGTLQRIAWALEVSK